MRRTRDIAKKPQHDKKRIPWPYTYTTVSRQLYVFGSMETGATWEQNAVIILQKYKYLLQTNEGLSFSFDWQYIYKERDILNKNLERSEFKVIEVM